MESISKAKRGRPLKGLKPCVVHSFCVPGEYAPIIENLKENLSKKGMSFGDYIIMIFPYMLDAIEERIEQRHRFEERVFALGLGKYLS
jgi:hypothetical protein